MALGRGAFPLGISPDRLLMVQTFIGIVGSLAACCSRQSQKERKASEASLRLSENRFRSAMQKLPIGMGIVDPDGRWLEVNPALCRIFGYTSEELLATNIQQIAHPDDCGGVAEFLSGLLQRKTESHQVEKRYLHKNGQGGLGAVECFNCSESGWIATAFRVSTAEHHGTQAQPV